MKPEIPQLPEELARKIRAADDSFESLRKPRFDYTERSAPHADLSFPAYSLFLLAESSNIARPVPVTSHRKVIGPFVVFAKKILMKLNAFYVRTCLRRQLVVNEHVVVMANAIVLLESRIRKLEATIAKVELQPKI